MILDINIIESTAIVAATKVKKTASQPTGSLTPPNLSSIFSTNIDEHAYKASTVPNLATPVKFKIIAQHLSSINGLAWEAEEAAVLSEEVPARMPHHSDNFD